MDNDELTLDQLDQVGTPGFIELNEFMTAYEQGNMQKVLEMGPKLIGNPMFDDGQREEIANIMDQAKKSVNHVEETKGFGL